MNWIERAKKVFAIPKPEHFTNFEHCDECFEYDELLRNCSVESIGLNELDGLTGDPFNFSSADGIRYYFPAMIRLALETMEEEYYLATVLWHLEGDGHGNKFVEAYSLEQCAFVASFLEYVIENFAHTVEANQSTDNLLRTYAIWSTV